MFMKYKNEHGSWSAMATGYVFAGRNSPIVVETKRGKCPSLSFCITTDRVYSYDKTTGKKNGGKSIYCNCVLYYFRSTAAIYEMVKKLRQGQYLVVFGKVFDQNATSADGSSIKTPRLFVEIVIDPNLIAMNQLGIDPDLYCPEKLTEKQVDLIPPSPDDDDYAFD